MEQRPDLLRRVAAAIGALAYQLIRGGQPLTEVP